MIEFIAARTKSSVNCTPATNFNPNPSRGWQLPRTDNGGQIASQSLDKAFIL
jgi:hypothetical protein